LANPAIFWPPSLRFLQYYTGFLINFLANNGHFLAFFDKKVTNFGYGLENFGSPLGNLKVDPVKYLLAHIFLRKRIFKSLLNQLSPYSFFIYLS